MDIPFTKTNISPILTCPNNGDVGDIYEICGIIKSISIPNGTLAEEVVVVPLLLLVFEDEEGGLIIICIGCSSVLSLLLDDDDGVLEVDCDRCNNFEEACGETEVGMGLVVVVGIMGVDADRFGADGFFFIGDRWYCLVVSSFTTPLLVQFLEDVLLVGAFSSLTKDEFNDDEVRPLCCRFTKSSGGGEVSLSSLTVIVLIDAAFMTISSAIDISNVSLSSSSDGA